MGETAHPGWWSGDGGGGGVCVITEIIASVMSVM